MSFDFSLNLENDFLTSNFEDLLKQRIKNNEMKYIDDEDLTNTHKIPQIITAKHNELKDNDADDDSSNDDDDDRLFKNEPKSLLNLMAIS